MFELYLILYPVIKIIILIKFCACFLRKFILAFIDYIENPNSENTFILGIKYLALYKFEKYQALEYSRIFSH